MSVSRRKFLQIGGASAFLLAGNFLGSNTIAFGRNSQALSAAKLPAEAAGDILMSYHAEDFRRLIGAKFSLFADNFAETAILVGVEENASNEKSKIKNRIAPADDFTLLFRVSKPEIEQATYTVIQSSLGQFDLFLVPEKKLKGEILLTAVINRP